MLTELKLETIFNYLFFLGDIHGDFECISFHCREKDLQWPSLYIQVGDFGYGFDKNDYYRMKNINEVLQKSNSHLLIVRGNHDIPSFFNGETKTNFSNIKFVKDNSIVTVNFLGEEKRIFCLGGATSIDRKEQAIQGIYYLDEKPTFCWEDEFWDQIVNIHIVVTHTAPQYFQPYNSNTLFLSKYYQKDRHLEADLMKERAEMNLLCNKLRQKNKETLKYWFYGHFHMSIKTEFEEITAILLDIREFYYLDLLPKSIT